MFALSEREMVLEKLNCDVKAVQKLDTYVSLLNEWQQKMNLVSNSTLPVVWSRHLWDSAQLSSCLTKADKTVLDLGSGAGFPALVLACLHADKTFVLMESDTKKCTFLQAVIDANGLDNVEIINDRIEKTQRFQTDIITARALASLDKLLAYALPFIGGGTRCVFMKGKKAPEELADARKKFFFDVEQKVSVTSDEGRILILSRVRKK